MRRLRQADFPRIWDDGAERHELDRALVLLHHALPERSYAELARLPIGRRDGMLLELRKATFGPRFNFVVVCPSCGERLEDDADIDVLLFHDPWQPYPEQLETTMDDCVLEFRLANTHDLAAVAELADAEAATQLARRCLSSARRGDTALDFDQLDEGARAALAEAMAEADPLAELEFAMECPVPSCGHQWAVLFDVAVFLWREIVTRAKLVLRDVHDLALRYGWNEAEILALAPARRDYYLRELGE
jgi:hypothetical protein